MRCLLEGSINEFTEIPVPHGKITIDIKGINPNYQFYIRDFFKGLGKEVKNRFGDCHMGTDTTISKKERVSNLDPFWITQMEVFDVYVTKGGRHAVKSQFKAKDGTECKIAFNSPTRSQLYSRFLNEISGLL